LVICLCSPIFIVSLYKKGTLNMENTKDWKQGMTNGHIAQIVRRKNVVRVVGSKKVYNRKKEKKVW